MIWKIAWRNIWRNTRRTCLSMMAIAFATMLLVFFTAMLNGFHEQMIKSSVTTYTGHIQINRKGFFGNETLDGFVESSDTIVNKIKEIPQIEAITTRIVAGGLASYEDVSIGCYFVGVKPEQEKKVTIFSRGVNKGKFLNTPKTFPIDIKYYENFKQHKITKNLAIIFLGKQEQDYSNYLKLETIVETLWLVKDKKNNKLYLVEKKKEKLLVTECLKEVIIGEAMARKLGVQVNDKITILSQGLDGSLEALELRIVGLFDVGNPEFNRNMIMLSHHTAAYLVHFGNDKVSQIIVKLKYNETLDLVIQKIKEIIKENNLKAFSQTQEFNVDNYDEVILFEGIEKEFQDQFVEPEKDISTETALEVISWKKILVSVIQFIQLDNALTQLLLTVVFLAVFIIIYNVTVMSVLERKREFGILKAVGIRSSQLIKIIFLETFLLSSIAALIGASLGVLISLYIYFFPIELSSIIEVFKMGMLKPVFIALFNEKCIIDPIFLVLFTALIAPLWPSWMLAKMSPVDAMHSV